MYTEKVFVVLKKHTEVRIRLPSPTSEERQHWKFEIGVLLWMLESV